MEPEQPGLRDNVHAVRSTGRGSACKPAPANALMLTKRAIASMGVLVVSVVAGYTMWHFDSAKEEAKSIPASSQAFGSAQRQNFAALRGATQPIPHSLQVGLQRVRNQTIRTLWLDTAKYVPVDDGIWVVNGKSETCIVQTRGGAVACVPRNILFRTGVALGVVESGPPPERKAREFIVYGFAPNQIKAVEVQIGDKKRSVAVRDNSYSLRAPEPIVITGFEH